MTDKAARAAEIEGYLDAQSSGKVALRIIPAADWYEYIELPQGRYGWTYPTRLMWPKRDNDPFQNRAVTPICPELIAHQTMTLDVNDLHLYVHTIGWFCDRYRTLVFDAEGDVLPDPIETQQQMEGELYGQSPEALSLLWQVQLSVLDA